MRKSSLLVLSLFLAFGLLLPSSCSDDTKPFEKPPVEKPDEKPDKPDKEDPDEPEEPVVSENLSGPPLPPRGKRWIRNEAFSDEFNGTELDKSKWYDYNPNWKGRPPALFDPSAISVSDGYLQIRNQKMAKDTIVNGHTFNIAGGAVRSKSDEAFYGYYECKFKASKTHMSTTFWLSSGYNRTGPKGDDRYSIELDIIETIGVRNGLKGTFHQGMNSNSHYKYTNSEGEKKNYSNGHKFPSDVSNSDVFNVYGAWWKDATQAELFFNNKESFLLRFNTQISPTPLDYPMGMNMVTETYDWIEVPTADQLNDDSRNTSYYDWVRSYTLVDVNDPNLPKPYDPNLFINGDFETSDLIGWGGWGNNVKEITKDPEHVNSGSAAFHIKGYGALEQSIPVIPNTDYRLSCYAKVKSGTINLLVKDGGSGNVIFSESEYTKKTVTFRTDNTGHLKIAFFANQQDSEGYADDFELVATNSTPPEPEPIVELYEESIVIDRSYKLTQNKQSIYVPYSYRANEDREVQFTLRNSDNEIVDTQAVTSYAGYANTGILLNVAEKYGVLKEYTISADIRPLSGSDDDIIGTDERKYVE